MGRSRRGILAGTAVALAVVALIAPAAAPAGAVPAKGSSDPCALLTSTDVGALSTAWTLDKTDELSGKNCLYYLQGDGDSATINLFVDKASDFSLGKALAKKTKKVSGLPSGYAGEITGGDAQVGFKAGTKSILVTSSRLDAPDLIIVAKAVKKHLS